MLLLGNEDLGGVAVSTAVLLLLTTLLLSQGDGDNAVTGGGGGIMVLTQLCVSSVPAKDMSAVGDVDSP